MKINITNVIEERNASELFAHCTDDRRNSANKMLSKMSSDSM